MSHIDPQRPLLFGSASAINGPSTASALEKSAPLSTSISSNSLASTGTFPDIDLGEIFDDNFFPDNLDFTAFFQDCEVGIAGDTFSRSLRPGVRGEGNSEGDDLIKVPLPIRMPRVQISQNNASALKREVNLHADEDEEDGKIDDDEDNIDESKRGGEKRYRGKVDCKDMTMRQKLERRERNREHAKRSRIRKKVLLDSLQDELLLVREENIKLRRIVAERMPHVAHEIFENCTALESSLLASLADTTATTEDIERQVQNYLSMESNKGVFMEDLNKVKQHAKILMEPDYRLIHSLVVSQQNFVLSDPSLPDNPIVYASEGFCKLSGYKRDEILGRNCRFLQGPGTDQAAVDVIRQGVAAGRDISVCLLNYKADGTPFWNQFFVGALRDSEGNVVNFVGIQCEVNLVPVPEIKDRVKRLPIPDTL